MKRVIIAVLALLLLSSSAFAHPGNTDSNGGHHVTDTGGYHYHHGKPAHQHPGGVCPYNKKKSQTVTIAERSTAARSETSSFSLNDYLTEKNIFLFACFLAVIVGVVILGISLKK